ncbi:sugar ABC transporter permease [Paenibacillus sp. N1-5-1-14]|uniref:carbohydrate ABC transporter permease n=1 Tax=Paenibacillus radicibacter TaxID=2972488 RepID=UPI0021594EF7|nr:sugar ABC transporter permease [Paenibacillus radicibacter]MCR8645175.1 sugar ABC transporter permease [Paenibacillus radicibacter]
MNGVLRVSKVTIALFVLPCLLFYIAFVFAPILVSFYYSLVEWSGMGLPKFVGMQNFVEMFTTDPIFWPSVGRTFVFAIFSVLEIPFALALAIIISRYVRRPNFLVSSYFIPVILSVVVVGQLWSSIYNPASLGGMLNKLLINLGLESWTHSWLAEPQFAMYAIFFVALWQYLGYHTLIQFTGVQNIPKELYEAARIDGAEGFTADRYITIPLAMPVIKMSVVLAVIGSLKAFDMIIVMTNGGPAHATDVISTHMYNVSFLSLKYGYGSALSTFLVIECLVATLLLNRLFKRSEDQIS